MWSLTLSTVLRYTINYYCINNEQVTAQLATLKPNLYRGLFKLQELSGKQNDRANEMINQAIENLARN